MDRDPVPTRPLGAALVILVGLLVSSCAPPASESIEAPDEPGWTFHHHAPEATTVAVVGDFNRWNGEAHQLVGPGADDGWHLTVPLESGRHGYMFLVDGVRLDVPEDAALLVSDGFGGMNGVVYVHGR